MQRLRNILKMSTVKIKAGIELNLVTLIIKDKEVMADYTQEKITKQNVPVFWVNMIIIIFNLGFNYYDYFQGGSTSLF